MVGSKITEGTEIRVYQPGTIYSETLGKYPIVFQAEVHAIGTCIQLFNIDKNYGRQKVMILSNSQEA